MADRGTPSWRLKWLAVALIAAATATTLLGRSPLASAYQHHSFRWAHTDIGVSVLDQRLQSYVGSGMYLWTSPSNLRAVAGDNIVVRVAPLLPPVHYAGQAAQANVAHSGGLIQQCEVRVEEGAFFALSEGARQAVITHELGHCLGIDHSLESSIMKNPFFYGFSDDDRAAVVALYGGVLGEQQPGTSPPPAVAPAPAPTPAPAPPVAPAPVPAPAPGTGTQGSIGPPQTAGPAPAEPAVDPSAVVEPSPSAVPADPLAAIPLRVCTTELPPDAISQLDGGVSIPAATLCAAEASGAGIKALLALLGDIGRRLSSFLRLFDVLRWP